jgi:hypothetical protein
MSIPAIPAYRSIGTPIGYLGGIGPFGLPLMRRPAGVIERVWVVGPIPVTEALLTEDSPRPKLAGVVTGP